MKKLMMVLVCFIASVSAHSKAEIKKDCYDNLLRGGNDSVVHQMNVGDISSDTSLRGMAKTGLNILLKSCGCASTIKKIRCGEAIKGNNLTEVCFAESEWGYFLVNVDYLDNLNIIFNRWD